MVANRKYAAPKEDDSSAISTRSEGSINPAHDREIDLRQMDEQDVKSLRKSDPFMYYSIPGVLNAALDSKDVDYSDIAKLGGSESRHSRAQDQADEEGDAVTKVSRKTRVSFERHSSVIMEDIMEDLEEEFGDLSIDLAELLSMFSDRNRSCSTRQ